MEATVSYSGISKSKAIQPAIHCQLGISRLPQDVNELLVGEIYSVLTDNVSIRFTLIVQSLAANLEVGNPCTYISSKEGDLFISRANAVGFDFLPYIDSGLLIVLTLKDEHVKSLYFNGIKQLITELDYFHVPHQSLLVLDNTVELLSVNDLTFSDNQLSDFQVWLKKNSITSILFLGISTVEHFPKSREAINQQFGGMVRILANEQRIKAIFDYWYTDYVLSTPIQYLLQLTKENSLECIDILEPAVPANENTVNKPFTVVESLNGYYYVGDGFEQGAFIHDKKWEHYKDLNQFVQNINELVPRLVIFSYSKDVRVSELLNAVSETRKHCHSHCKIVIRENQYSLRFYDELNLLKNGVNLIVYQNLGAFRTHLAIDNLKNITFHHFYSSMQVDTDAATYQKAGREFYNKIKFRNYIVERIESLSLLRVPFALVKIPLMETSFSEENCNKAKIRRDDMMLINEAAFWVFLMNCDTNNACLAMRRFCVFENTNFSMSDLNILIASSLQEVNSFLQSSGFED